MSSLENRKGDSDVGAFVGESVGDSDAGAFVVASCTGELG